MDRRHAPLAFPISPYRSKEVTLQLTQPADGKPLYWRIARITEKAPGAYRLARVLKQAKQTNLKVRLPLGWALQSAEVSDEEKLVLLKIHQLRGVVNFYNSSVGRLSRNVLNNVLIGSEWTGGDKTFAILQKVPSLKLLLLARDSGVSSGALGKLQAALPDLAVRRFERTPSPRDERCAITIRNRTDKEVLVYWVDYVGELRHARKIKPGAEQKLGSSIGSRFEAHIDGKLISKFVARPDASWEIKAGK